MAHPERFLLAGIMGFPVMHSRSPKLHNYWFNKHGLAGTYVPLQVPPDNLAAALRALPALGFAGCNLTIPHKVLALGLVDEVEPVARRIGAVNTIVVGPGGRLIGRNTDWIGFVESVVEAAPHWRGDAGPAVILGAGGGARAILAGLLDRGAKEIRLLNRGADRAAEIAAEFGNAVKAYPWGDRAKALDGAAILVNTTSLGMVGQPALELSLDKLPKTAIVSDIVYIPRETPLLLAARARGNPVVYGLGMLLHQARPAFEAWFGIKPEVTPELRAVIEATL